VLIVFSLCQESLKMILVDETPPCGGSVTQWSLMLPEFSAFLHHTPNLFHVPWCQPVVMIHEMVLWFQK
jgi:hypothetical protein